MDPLGDFLALRKSLETGAIGDGGRDVCLALTTVLDSALRDIVSGVAWDGDYALVAVGGYGRSELSPYSDVDLMVLHDSDDPSDLAAGIFRPLWDANLKVGHSIRTLGEAAAAAKERFETHTTLMTARLIAGSRGLFVKLSAEVAAVTKARPLRRYLVEEERERRRRNPYIVMATDVKNGRGGLRTLQGFGWVEAREQIIGRYSLESSDTVKDAYESLLRVRNALHAVAGRRYDTYSHDLREPVARWLGADTFDVARQLIEAVESADRTASHRWPEVTEEPELSRLQMLRRSKNLRTDRAPTAPELVSILRRGEKGRLALERLRRAGHLGGVLPEWSQVRGLPQLDPFHEHPVGAHLWRTVDEMQYLIESEDDHYASVAAEVGSDQVLTLTAFLHDIGKGRGEDHSESGARIARSACGRLGCPADVTDLVVAGVRHHLLLGRTAARRDIDDASVIDDVAETVGDLRTLQVLYLLTVADSRATGTTMWSEWKATLLRTLFIRVAARFGAGEPSPTPAEIRTALLAGIVADRRGVVADHLEMMADEYLRESSAKEILWHVDQICDLNGGASIDVVPGEATDELVVVGRDHPDFRRIVAEAFAANGIDVLQARLRSRSDGLTVDSFVVDDDRTGGSVDVERWDRVRDDIDAALAGDLDTTGKVADRARAYAVVEGRADVRPEVKIYHDPSSGDPVLAIRCGDRVGRLAQLLAVLSRFGIEIRLAKLDSRAGELIDTFHVGHGAIPDDAVSVRRLEAEIASAIDT